MRFEAAFDFLMRPDIEGGYVNNPNDPGGATKFGISSRAFPNEDIVNMTRERAGQLYHQHYWLACRCGELPPGIDLLVFDAAVNQGPRAAVQMLQESINAQGGIRIVVDGEFGPKTMAALRRCDSDQLVTEMAAQRMETYGRNPKFLTDFGLGWSRRLMKCVRLAFRTYV